MDKEIAEIEQFEKYKNGKMTAAEKTAFEQQLEQDKALAQKYQLFLDLQKVIKSAGNQQIISDLQAVQAKLEKEQFFNSPKTTENMKKDKTPKWENVLAIAATVLIILLSGIYWWNSEEEKRIPTQPPNVPASKPLATGQKEMLTTIERAKKMPLEKAQIYLDSLKTKIAKKFGERDSMMAKLLYRKGAEYFKKKKFESAIELFHQVQDIQKEVYEEGHSDISKIEHGLGTAYAALNEDEAAIKHYQNAIDLRREYKNNRISVTYRNLARIYKAKNEYELASRYYFLAVEEAYNANFRRDARYSLALVLDDLKESDLALEQINIILQEFDAFSEKELLQLPAKQFIQIIECYNTKGQIYDDKKDYKQALANYQKAIRLYQLSKMEGQTPILFSTYNNLAISYRNLQNYDKAIGLLKQSLELKKAHYQTSFHPYYASTLNNLGDIHLRQKDYAKALDYYQNSINNLIFPQVADDIFQEIVLDNFSVTGDKSHLLTNLETKARVLVQWYEIEKDKKILDAALHTSNTACALIDDMRGEHSEENSKLFWRNETRPVYETAIDIAFRLKDENKAFEFFEKSKAALLLDALKNETAKKFIPDEIAIREKALQAEISALEQELHQSDNQQEKLSQILALKEELNTLILSLKAQYPRYFEYRYDTKVASIEEIKQKLAENNSSLIEYALIGDYVYTFVLDKANIRLIRLSQPIDFEKKIRTLLNLVSSKNNLENNKGFLEYQTIAHEFYQSLIDPLNLKTKRLVIVPDGVLNYLPFELLVKDFEGNQTDYLLQNHLVSYAYSSTVLLQSQAIEHQSNGEVLAFAPIDFSLAIPFSKDTTKTPSHLYEGEIELDNILKIIAGEKYIMTEANLSTFRKKAAPFSILHLSTHASAASQGEEQPWIAFYDDYLFLPEIYPLHLNADLVVLSACETSKGDFKTGEGVMSLARGFAYAGVPATVTSLWEVNEQATTEIMELFYQNIRQNQAKDVALQNAKLSYLEKYPYTTPHFWAAFIQTGDTSSLAHLKHPTSFKWPWLLGSCALLGIILFFFRKKR